MRNWKSCRRLAITGLSVLTTLGAGNTTQSARARPDPISSGGLYLYGHAIPAPYELTADSGALSVNGVRIFPRVQADAAPGRRAEIPDDVRRRHELRQCVIAMQRELASEGRELRHITPFLVKRFRTETALIDSVTGVRDDEFWIWWRGRPQAEQFLVRATRDRPEPSARVEEERALLQRALERGCLVIVTSTRQLIFPKEPGERLAEIRREIERARRASPLDLTPQRWGGRHFDHEVARVFHDPLALPCEE